MQYIDLLVTGAIVIRKELFPRDPDLNEDRVMQSLVSVAVDWAFARVKIT